jgi:hypothetical protein
MSLYILLTLTCATHKFTIGAKNPRMIKPTGHVSCTGKKRNKYGSGAKIEGNRSFERPFRRWFNNIKTLLKEVK